MYKLIIFYLLITTSCFAQFELRNNPFLKGNIVLNNGEKINGFIQLNGSAFDVKFKEIENNKKSNKIDYKNIERIIINSNSSNTREFYYKKTDANKFYKFVELIYSNVFEVYIYSEDNQSLFYSDVDRSNVTDWLNYEQQEASKVNSEINKLKDLKNGSANSIKPYYKPSSYQNFKNNISKLKNIQFLMFDKNSNKLIFINSNKKLLEFASANFNDCSKLISRIENKELKKEDIIEIVDFFNNCTN